MNRRSIRTRFRQAVANAAATRSRQVAETFLRALALLAVALLAALFSNSSAREGKVLAAAVGALVAMAIAAWVSVRLVPKMASGVEWRWLPLLTQHRLTREGWIHLAATGVVFLAAVNTSNNLLYMILSAQLALLLLGVLLAGVNFRDVQVRAEPPAHCFAQEPFRLTLALHNRKHLFPTFSVEAGPAADGLLRFAGFYAPVIPPDDRVVRDVEVRLETRGLHPLQAVRLTSRYPFGFFRKGGAFPVGGQVVVYPEIMPREALDPAASDLMGVAARIERGGGLDLYGIRDYLPSDGVRTLDWKAFAKTTTLKTREFAAEESQTIRILFDRYGVPAQRAAFERLVSYTASLVYHWTREGAEVRFASDDWSSGRGQTEGGLHAILRYLALTEMTPLAGEPPDDGHGAALRISLRAQPAGGKGQAWDDISRSHFMR